MKKIYTPKERETILKTWMATNIEVYLNKDNIDDYDRIATDLTHFYPGEELSFFHALALAYFRLFNCKINSFSSAAKEDDYLNYIEAQNHLRGLINLYKDYQSIYNELNKFTKVTLVYNSMSSAGDEEHYREIGFKKDEILYCIGKNNNLIPAIGTLQPILVQENTDSLTSTEKLILSKFLATNSIK